MKFLPSLFAFLFTLFFSLLILDYQLYVISDKDILVDLSENMVREKIGQQLENITAEVEKICEQSHYINYDGFNVSCSEIKSKGVLRVLTEFVVDQYYYKNYSCVPPSCWMPENKEDLFVYLSYEGHLFYKNMFLPLALASILSFIAAFAFAEDFSAVSRKIGWFFVFFSLPALLPRFYASGEFSSILLMFSNIFFYILAAGIFFLVIGYAFKK